MIDFGTFTNGLIVGLIIGCGIGPIFVRDLKRRVRGSTIQKVHGKQLLPYSIVIIVIVFYREIGSFFCPLLGIQERQGCLSAIYGALDGALFTLFIMDLIWMGLWEYHHKQPLYFE